MGLGFELRRQRYAYIYFTSLASGRRNSCDDVGGRRAACAGETVEVPGETVVVEKEVIKTVEVPGETVVKEVIKEVMVPGETVVVKEEVVKTVEVP